MRIDVHAHHYPEQLIKHMSELGVKWPASRQTESLTKRLADLDGAGTDVQVIELGARQPYLPVLNRALEAARYANDLYKQEVDNHRGRYAAFGCVPLPHVDAAIAEAARCLDELGFPGLGVGCSVANRPLEDPTFDPFWEELDRRRAIVTLHPLGIGARMGDDYGLDWMVAGCFEDTIAALRLVMSGFTTRFPKIRFIVPHLGGVIPFIWQRIEDHLDRVRAEGQPSAPHGTTTTALRGFFFDTVNQSPAALRCACETVGADRILLGSDYPFLKVTDCVSFVSSSGLDSDEVTRVLDVNAQALLGLRGR